MRIISKAEASAHLAINTIEWSTANKQPRLQMHVPRQHVHTQAPKLTVQLKHQSSKAIHACKHAPRQQVSHAPSLNAILAKARYASMRQGSKAHTCALTCCDLSIVALVPLCVRAVNRAAWSNDACCGRAGRLFAARLHNFDTAQYSSTGNKACKQGHATQARTARTGMHACTQNRAE